MFLVAIRDWVATDGLRWLTAAASIGTLFFSASNWWWKVKERRADRDVGWPEIEAEAATLSEPGHFIVAVTVRSRWQNSTVVEAMTVTAPVGIRLAHEPGYGTRVPAPVPTFVWDYWLPPEGTPGDHQTFRCEAVAASANHAQSLTISLICRLKSSSDRTKSMEFTVPIKASAMMPQVSKNV